MKDKVIDPKCTLPNPNLKHSVEYYSAAIVAFFCAIFSLWTIGSNTATIFGLTWEYLSEITTYVLPLFFLFSLIVARSFANAYCYGLPNNKIFATLPSFKFIAVLSLAATAIFVAGSYTNKYYVFSIAALTIYILSRGVQNCHVDNQTIQIRTAEKRDIITLIIIILIAVSVVLFAHRPDLDDSSFLQIVNQTLIYSDRPLLSFDTSLGIVLDSFRFAPYRVSSYETLVAFVSDILNINIYNVYYLFLPAITACLTILTAFVFSRWFLHTNTLALAATAVFMIVMLAWGETHYAYGNRVFIRLFQGKGLIVALTTPFAILTGLMLVNRPSFSVTGVLALANISAIGVSSSGLVATIFTSITVLVLAICKNFKNTICAWALIGATMIYPVLIAAWLKFGNKILISMSNFGTHLPINASLGMDIRESILLISLLLGLILFIQNHKKSYMLLIVAIFAFILNPWLSELISNVTARNMSWRLAWAAPIPLLLSIALVAGLSTSIQNKSLSINNRAVLYVVKITALALLFVFAFANKWVTSTDNNLSWGMPTAKLPNNFYVASQIATRLELLNINGQVLAHRDIAAWLPLTLPGVKLVMPGHTYPDQLQTILPSHEFNSRMAIFNPINKGVTNIEEFLRSIDNFNVELVVVPDRIELSGQNLISRNREVRLEKIESFLGFSLYKLVRTD
ncbi:MAG: hypothetical protein J5820_03525 [Rhodocyclaceae bacterium]|nr:hypothetical protein [Rhodocyclaceae bacterium]